MKIYKFGGASVRSAEAIKQVGRIIEAAQSPTVVVVSAMGKMTNRLEELCNDFFYKKNDTATHIAAVRQYHLDIVEQLFAANKKAEIEATLDGLIAELQQAVAVAPSLSYDYEYDRIVSFGERISTAIVSAYLNSIGQANQLIDIRTALKTDDNYRDANIDMTLSEQLCRATFTHADTPCYITQGFIAGTTTNQTTTLGREGSDYTAAVLANLLDAESVTIWKDVPGVMNADPKLFAEAEIMPRISYKEAVELSHCGAQIIHPKTIKPIQNKNIPLRVKSFVNPQAEGSIILNVKEKMAMPPVYIVKRQQLLLTLTPRDFSFVAEEKLSHIFALLAKYRLKLHLIQLSAINFTFLIDYNAQTFDQFVDELQKPYEVHYNQNVTLLTIRHYNDQIVERLTAEKRILVEQRSRLTARFVIKDF